MNFGFSKKCPCQRAVKGFFLAAELNAGGEEAKTEFQDSYFPLVLLRITGLQHWPMQERVFVLVQSEQSQTL